MITAITMYLWGKANTADRRMFTINITEFLSVLIDISICVYICKAAL